MKKNLSDYFNHKQGGAGRGMYPFLLLLGHTSCMLLSLLMAQVW